MSEDRTNRQNFFTRMFGEQGANEGNEFTESSYETEYQRARDTQDSKANRANNSNKGTRCQLRSNIGGEGAANIFKKLVAAPAPTSARKHL